MDTVSSAAAPAPALAARRSVPLGRLGDELLARQAAGGSERAFAALYERYHQPLYRYCRSIVRNNADAQDVLQSTFTSALSALRRDHRNAPLRPWLYRIAHNESISLLRRRSRESAQELLDGGSQLVASAADQAADRARWATLVADLARLPERQRTALLLRELSGLSHEEIASTLGTGVSGAKQAIFEARQGLAELVEGRAMSCDEVRRRLSDGDRRVLRGRRVSAHLRECHSCEAFAAEIRPRRVELRALTPVLPSAVAADLLSRSLRAASTHGGSGAVAGSAATAGAVGKLTGTALTGKALTGVALVAAAAAGVTGLRHVVRETHARALPSAPARHMVPAATNAAGARAVASSSATGSTRQGGARAGGTTSAEAHRSAAASSGTVAASGTGTVALTLSVASAVSNGIGRATRSHGSGAAASSHRAQGVGHSPARGQSTTSHGRGVGHSHSSVAGRSGSGSAKHSGSSSTSGSEPRSSGGGKPQSSGHAGVGVTVTSPAKSQPAQLADSA